MEDERNPVDVFIVGGGLAGLALAIQLKRARPDTHVVVAESKEHPAPRAGFKVGESTIDGGGFYFGDVLGMGEHLRREQLYKGGFRFHVSARGNTDVTERFELATSRDIEFPTPFPAYQIDRGTFETALGKEVVRRGGELLTGCKVERIELADDAADMATIRYVRDGVETETRARWVVDASGYRSMLKRQLGLGKAVDHKVNAAWFRVDGVVSVHDWSNQPEWRSRFPSSMRRLATNHLTGKGYWVWLIPLAGDFTSVGIVADDDLHPFRELNTRDKALEWLRRYEPQCAAEVAKTRMVDFLSLKHFARNCEQVFSAKRWAITGVAGVFSDPLFSPGNELIAVSNSIITDLVCRELDGEDIGARVDDLNRFYLDFIFDTTIDDIRHDYPLLDSSFIVSIKKVWQAVWYWSIFCPLIFDGRTADVAFLESIADELAAFKELHRRFKSIYHDLYARGPHTTDEKYAIYTTIETLFDIVYDQPGGFSSESLRALIRHNLGIVRSVVASLEERLHPTEEHDTSHRADEIDPDIVAEFRAFWSHWRAHPQHNALHASCSND